MMRTRQVAVVGGVLAIIAVLAPAGDATVAGVGLGKATPMAAVSDANGDEALLAYDPDHSLIVATRPLDGLWSTHPLGVIADADIGIDGEGHPTVAYIDDDGIFAVSQTTTGWSDPVSLEASPGWSVRGRSVDIAMNESGAAVVAYLSGAGPAAKAVYRTADGSWGAPITLNATHSGLEIGAVIDSAGHATVAWTQQHVTGPNCLYLATATSDTSGAFGNPTELTTDADGGVELTTLAGDAAGDGAIAYRTSAFVVRYRPAGGSFGAAHVLASATTDQLADGPTVSVSPDGDAVALWTTIVETPKEALCLRASRRIDGKWSAPRIIRNFLTDNSSAARIGSATSVAQASGVWRLLWTVTRTGASETTESRTWLPADNAPGPLRKLLPSTALGDPYRLYVPEFVAARGDGEPNGVLSWAALETGADYGLHWYAADLDGTQPTATLTAPSNVFSRTQEIHVAWFGRDTGSGVDGYVVRRRAATLTSGFGVFGSWRSTTGTIKTAAFRGVRGTTYCFDARAVDAQANQSNPTTQRCVAVPLDDRDLTASAGWARGTGPAFYNGTYQVSTTKGSTLRVRLRTRTLSLGVERCRSCGKVAVYLDDRRLATISLAGPRGRALVPIHAFTAAHRGLLRVVVLSSDRPVRVDYLATSQHT